MALTPRLDLRQTQSLVMTPQLQQAIKLLQLSNIELNSFLEQELERNPLLEREDSDDARDSQSNDADSPELFPAAEEPILDGMTIGEALSSVDVDSDYDNIYNTDSPAEMQNGESFAEWGQGGGGKTDFSGEAPNLEETLVEEGNLRDHLIAQITLDIRDPADRLIAFSLLELLDEAGYLVGDLVEVASTLNCSLAEVEAVLRRLQGMDPVGIFARSLRECLALQLAEKNRLDPAMALLLDNLEMLARRDLSGLMARCAVDAEDMTEMIREIKALDPKPALRFDPVLAAPVVPDVLMRRSSDGGWLVELNAETLPRVLVNMPYYAKVAGSVQKREEKSYLSEQFQSANWLVKSLHQRATTILKVASEIVRQQDAFFHHGIRSLKPLVLRDIALVVGMHESTISRVTSNKYLLTPRGIYELKYFFTQSVGASNGGDAHSAEAVRDRIRTMIGGEGPEVLSDDRIVEILKAGGIEIARRTVAKYREALGIPSSVRRKKEKSLR